MYGLIIITCALALMVMGFLIFKTSFKVWKSDVLLTSLLFMLGGFMVIFLGLFCLCLGGVTLTV